MWRMRKPKNIERLKRKMKLKIILFGLCAWFIYWIITNTPVKILKYCFLMLLIIGSFIIVIKKLKENKYE